MLKAAALLLLVWMLFPLAQLLLEDQRIAFFAACTGATILLLAMRRRDLWESALPPAPALAIGLVAGVGVATVILLGIDVLVGAPDTTPTWLLLAGVREEGFRDPIWAAAIAALSPVFQELLYREQLLGTLRGVLGGIGAVAVTSALGAVFHVEAAAMITPFIAGIVYGTLMLHTGSLPLVLGLHMGLNSAVISGWPGQVLGT